VLEEEYPEIVRAVRLLRRDAWVEHGDGAFACLAIFVACLGLFGLTAFAAEQRTKEVGVRKVLGATVPGIVATLSGDFLRLVVVANAVAWPLAWLALQKWLQGFPYRVDLGLGIFAASGVSTLLIAALTVGYQAAKAASADPVESLRHA